MKTTVASMGMVGMMAAGAALATPPQVTNVTLVQPDKTRLAVVTYETDGPGIATFQFKTNGVPLAGLEWTTGGDINKYMPVAGRYTFTWDAGHDVPEQMVSNLTAEVTLWATNAPPPYCAVNLVTDGNGRFPVRFYTSAGEVPLGVANGRWKKDWLLMRQIPSTGGGSVTLGSPSGEWKGSPVPTDEALRMVRITAPFYMGVYTVTQRQWEDVAGAVRSKPSYWNNTTDWEGRPVEQVSYYEIRENDSVNYNKPNADYSWPGRGHAVHPSSFMGMLRAKTGGLIGFDLPTEAQWEYACRAGTTGPWNNDIGASNNETDANLAQLGRYQRNDGQQPSGTGYASWPQGSDASKATATVGSYLPNAWGLYDMHGNVWEWTLDWYVASDSSLLGDDPTGPASGSTARALRGGAWGLGASYCRSARRLGDSPTDRSSAVGFRVAAPAVVLIAE